MEDKRNDIAEKNGFRERAGDFLREKGVYLVLLICIAIVGVAAAAAYMPGRSPEPEQESRETANSSDQRLDQAVLPTPVPTPVPTQVPTPKPTAQAAAAPDTEAVSEPGPTARPTAQPQAGPTATPAREKASPPVKGPVQWRFAADELVYSKTLDQWMTHSGVDLSAPLGAEVHAVWPGTVDQVYRDDALGVCVRLAHSGGLQSLYANLRSDAPVKEGQRVEAGQVIGHVGDTARSECGQDAHLHFEVIRDGRLEDPMEHIIVIEE